MGVLVSSEGLQNTFPNSGRVSRQRIHAPTWRWSFPTSSLCLAFSFCVVVRCRNFDSSGRVTSGENSVFCGSTVDTCSCASEGCFSAGFGTFSTRRWTLDPEVDSRCLHGVRAWISVENVHVHALWPTLDASSRSPALFARADGAKVCFWSPAHRCRAVGRKRGSCPQGRWPP